MPSRLTRSGTQALSTATTLSRRQVGTALFATWAAAISSGRVQAAPAEPAAAGAIVLDLSVELTVRQGDSKQTVRSEVALALAPGKTGRLALPYAGLPATQQLLLNFTVEERPQDMVMIRADLQRGEPPASVATPRVLTKFGTRARIERGDDRPDGAEQLSITVTPRRAATQG